MTISRGALRSDIQRRLSKGHKALIQRTVQMTGANSDLMKKAGAVLQKHIRKQLSTPAASLRQSIRPQGGDPERGRRMRGEPSAPGEAPRKITGALRRGVKNKVVEGERTVLAQNFRSKIMEFGFEVPAEAARMTRKRGRTRKDGTFSLHKKQHMLPAKTSRKMAARPFMRPGFDAAKPELATVGAQILRENIRHGALGLQAGALSGGGDA